jgi:sulfopyruvate decarboxylase subunit beta
MANKRPANLTVIVFDNQCYMATGGLPTATAGPTDLAGIAKAAGINHSYSISTLKEFEEHARATLGRRSPSFSSLKLKQLEKE